ncbi:MAG TPA: hypothetical protein VMR74_10910 [Gammaproteobacteria bacterium]|nr:hypothetical protein [Gammaproteobacteria bacterium]
MARNVLLLVAGAIAGGAAVYFAAGREAGPAGAFSAGVPDASPTSADMAGAGDVEAGDVGASEPVADGFVAARVAAYERALEATDVIDLESTIGLALAAPRSRARDLDISALLARLAELDPRRAVDFAQTAFLDTPFLIQVFETLARADRDAAVAALARVAPAAKQRQVALALLDVFGHERGVALVGSALPDETRASFELDALIARAETDPAGAMAEANGVNSTVLRGYLVPRLAEAAVGLDPGAALALGDSIDDYNSRLQYRIAVLNAWADLDPDAVLAFLETADPALLSTSGGVFAALARHDADAVLAMVGDLPPSARASARQAVMQSLIDSDPEAALAIFDTMPPGRDRERMLSTIARAYGSEDPQLAIAWARSLSPPSPGVLQRVLQGIAAVDADLAVDLLLEELDGQAAIRPGASFSGSIPFATMSMLSSGGADVSRLAQALLDRNDPQSRALVSSAIGVWASTDLDAALSWTLANADRLDPAALSSLAGRMADEDLDLALNMLDRIEPAHRLGWIQGVTSQMARTDIARAQSFLSQLRGQPGYDEAYASIVQAMTRTDPAGAARMLSDAPSSSRTLESASLMIAREWADRDPAAAAGWALTLEDSPLQRGTVTNVAMTWALRDAAEAERWLFGLASGPNRDAAADGYINAAAQTGRFEARVLDAYSSEQARQQGASRAILMIGSRDPARAEQLLDRHVTDPAIRARTEQQLARSLDMSNLRVLISDDSVIFAQ